MSEPILDALIQLFALIIDIDENNRISEREKEVIRQFLIQQLNHELAQKYMVLFEEYLLLFHKDDYYQDHSKRIKRKTLTARKIIGICNKINEELQQSQKIYVVIQLIEFIAMGEVISEKETHFLSTVASTFNIPKKEYNNIFTFIVGTVHDIPDKEKILVVNNVEKCMYDEVKHKYDPNFSGELFFLKIESTRTYILRYYGYNDLYLNSQNIVGGRTYSFEHGSSIRSQTINTIFYTDVVGMFSVIESDSKISVTARNVTFRFKNTQNGIQKFNMKARSGSLVAIMGGSGVGKSTLINVLNGNLKPQTGEVYFNNFNLNDSEERNKLKGIIGLVPQDDLLIEDLTVYQNLYYSARLCLDDLNHREIEEVVNRALDELDLTDAKDLKVGNPLKKIISGGQRKRLNIALELIREPAVLFVDEPTSGLSSIEAECVMNLLKEQSDNGKLVIVNIHQPSSYLYKMFDEVLILDKGGYQIYYGNPMEAIVYFKRMSNHANPNEDQCSSCGTVNTDQLLHIIDAKVVNEHGKLTNTRKVSPEEWSRLFNSNIEIRPDPTIEKDKIPETSYSLPNRLKQLYLFFRRDLQAKLANRQYILISLLEAPLLAFILGYFTKYISGTPADPHEYVFFNNENLPAYLFMCVVVSLFLGLIVSSEEIIRERKILKRESFLNLSRSSFLHSKILILFILSAVQTISFIVIGNSILEIKGMTTSYWIILFSSACFANMLGLNISSAFDNVITVYILIPFLLIPQLLFSGVIVKFDKLHRSLTTYEYVPLIGDVMTSRWAYEALAVHQFKDNRYEKILFKDEMENSQNSWYARDLIPDLKRKNSECLFAIGKEEYRDDFENKLLKLEKYTKQLSDLAGIDNSHLLINLNSEKFDSLTSENLADALNKMSIYFTDRMLRATGRLDSIVNARGNDNMLELMNKYHNQSLATSVRSLTSMKIKLETRTRILQKSDPVFMIPRSKIGRAHFFAPVKNIGNHTIDTFWFNTAAIWLLTILLYIALQGDLLRRALNYFDRLGKKAA